MSIHKSALAFAALSLIISGCTRKSAPEPIVVGHLAPRSGLERQRGLNAEKGIQLALEALKTTDTVAAGRPFVVLHSDTQNDPEQAQSIAVRLLTINNAVALIGAGQPAAAERLTKAAQQYKAPLLTPTWLPGPTLGPYGFTVAALPVEQGKALAKFARKKLGMSQLAVVSDSRDAAASALTAAFVDSAGKPAVVFQEEYGKDPNWPQFAQQTVAAKPQAILLSGSVANLEKFRSALGKAGLPPTVPLLFGGQESEALFALADGALGVQDLYWTTPFVKEAATEAGKAFIKQFEEKFQMPPDAATVLAHEAAALLFDAVRRAKPLNGDRVREELLKTKDFPGITAPLTFDKSQAVQRPVFVVQRQDRQVKQAGPPPTP